jgi:hypothetical protein
MARQVPAPGTSLLSMDFRHAKMPLWKKGKKA